MDVMGKKFTGKDIIILIGVIALITVLFFVELNSFKNEIDKEPLVNLDTEITDSNHISLVMQIISIDAVKGDVTIRVVPEAKGDLIEDGVILTKDINIYTNSVSGKNEQNYSKGKRIGPFDVVIDMEEGSVMEYPYDKHNSELSLYVTTPEKDSTGKVTNVPVPIVKETDFSKSVAGYSVTDVKEKDAGHGYSELTISLARSKSVKLFSQFVMITMWLMAICVFLVIFAIIVRNRKVEYSMFAFLSAMLFALPALRNVQPFVPSIGCLSDYAAFFWAETIVAGSLILMVITWLKRPGPKQG